MLEAIMAQRPGGEAAAVRKGVSASNAGAGRGSSGAGGDALRARMQRHSWRIPLRRQTTRVSADSIRPAGAQFLGLSQFSPATQWGVVLLPAGWESGLHPVSKE